jgi:hypothetical protein
MRFLLAGLPYVAAIALYWLTASNMVTDAKGEVPSNWNWRLVGPVMVGGLTPLALAASDGVDGSQQAILLSAPAIAIVFTVVLMAALWDGSGFFRLQRPISAGPVNYTRFPRWRVVVLAGTAVLGYGAVVNVMVAGQTDPPDQSVPPKARSASKR